MKLCPISGAQLVNVVPVRLNDGVNVAVLTTAVSEAIQGCADHHTLDDLRAWYEEAVRRVEYWIVYEYEMAGAEPEHRGITESLWHASKNIAPSSLAGIAENLREAAVQHHNSDSGSIHAETECEGTCVADAARKTKLSELINLGLMALASLETADKKSSRRTMRLASELSARFLTNAGNRKRRQGKKGRGLTKKEELLQHLLDKLVTPVSGKIAARWIPTELDKPLKFDGYEIHVEGEDLLEYDLSRKPRRKSGHMKVETFSKELAKLSKHKFSE